MVRGSLTVVKRKTFHAALFFDDTALKDRLRGIFAIQPPMDRPEFNTLGFAVVEMGKWVVENLNYPIAFTEEMLHRLYVEQDLYGDKMREYDAYFTTERCAWIRTRLLYADRIARKAIQEAVGFDPDTTLHPLSNLGKGHYAPILWSAEDYLEEIRKETPPWMKKSISAASVTG